MRRRVYQNEADLPLLQAFNAVASAVTAGCGFIHPGDIPHRIFNGCRRFDPAEVLTIWEGGDEIGAWSLAQPSHRAFDAQVRPDLRDSDLEREVLEYVEQQTVGLLRSHGTDADGLLADAYRCDTVRASLLTEMGWLPDGEPPWVLNRAPLTDIAVARLPDGYSIRAARGVEEAAALAEVHAGSFGSAWTADAYRKVMESPGYAAERELVVEAPDGTLAAFTITWHDDVNRTGLLEPVGTLRDHRRLGLGRALVLHAMNRMAEAGMEYATVLNEGTNQAASELYRASGFEPWHLLDGYVKPPAGGVTTP